MDTPDVINSQHLVWPRKEPVNGTAIHQCGEHAHAHPGHRKQTTSWVLELLRTSHWRTCSCQLCPSSPLLLCKRSAVDPSENVMDQKGLNSQRIVSHRNQKRSITRQFQHTVLLLRCPTAMLNPRETLSEPHIVIIPRAGISHSRSEIRWGSDNVQILSYGFHKELPDRILCLPKTCEADKSWQVVGAPGSDTLYIKALCRYSKFVIPKSSWLWNIPCDQKHLQLTWLKASLWPHSFARGLGFSFGIINGESWKLQRSCFHIEDIATWCCLYTIAKNKSVQFEGGQEARGVSQNVIPQTVCIAHDLTAQIRQHYLCCLRWSFCHGHQFSALGSHRPILNGSQIG